MSDLSLIAMTKSARAVDEVIDGMGVYSGKTLDALQAEYGELTLMSAVEARDFQDGSAITPPTRIDESSFFYLLEVLPPSRWSSFGGWEVFYVPEALVGDVHTVVVRKGKRDFFKMARSVRKEGRADWIKLCEDFLAAEREPVAAE